MIEWIVSSCALITILLLIRRIFRGKITPRLQYALWLLVLGRVLLPFSFFQSGISTAVVVEQVKQSPEVQSITDRLSKPSISYEQAYQQAVKDFQESGIASPELPSVQPETIAPTQTQPVPEVTLPLQTVPAPDVTEPAQTIPETTVTTPTIALPDYENPNYIPQTPLELHTQEILDQSTPYVILEKVLLWIWIAGIVFTAGCLLISNLRFRKHLKRYRVTHSITSNGLKVYTCSGLETPCLFGMLKPAIYLTPEEAADEIRTTHILAHESTHFRHWDHIWSFLRCVCLALHWYNPFVWLAAILSRQDAELACDETTIRKIGESERVSYGRTLIEMTRAKNNLSGLFDTATTMTGSKTAIKERVTMIAKKPKMALYTLIVVLLIAAVAVGCTFSELDSTEGTSPTPPTQQEVVLPELTLEMKADINFPWFQHLNEFPVWYSEETDDTQKGGIRYYGTYGDLIVFFKPGVMIADAFEDNKVIGYQVYVKDGTFLIFRDGIPTKYQQFDQISGLTEEELMQVYQIHRQYTLMIWDHNLDTDRTIRFENDVFGTVEPKKDYYLPLEEVTVKVPNATDTGFLFLMNGQKIELSSWDDTYWYFTFRIPFNLPYSDVNIDFKTFDGFLSFSGEDTLIEAYFLANRYLDHVFVRHYYGTFESGAIVAIIDGREFLDLPWEETISHYIFRYENRNRIQVFYGGEFYTLPDAYAAGYLTDMDLKNIADRHAENYPQLYTSEKPYYEITDLPYAEWTYYEDSMNTNSSLQFFLGAYYESPDKFPLYDLLHTLTNNTYLVTQEQFQDLISLPDFPYRSVTEPAQLPCRVLVFSKSRIQNVLRLIGTSLEELEQPFPTDGSILYSSATENYYCLLKSDVEKNTSVFEIWDACLSKEGICYYYGCNRTTGEFFFITAKEHSLYPTSYRKVDFTQPSHSLDPSDQIREPYLYYNGKLYKFAHSLFLPSGATYVGTVLTEDNMQLPSSHLHASQLTEGTKIFTGADNGMLILYAMRPDGFFYRLERCEPPTLEEEPLAYYQMLFRDDQWMNLIASLPFGTPEEFCDTFLSILCTYNLPSEEPITSEERAYLESVYGHPIEIAIHRIPRDILHEAVMQYLGIDIYQLPKEDLPTYNPATGCYYTTYNGAEGLLEAFRVTDVKTEGDLVYVTMDLTHWINTVTLQVTDGNYRFLSVTSNFIS